MECRLPASRNHSPSVAPNVQALPCYSTFLNFDPDGHQVAARCGPRCARIGGVSTNNDQTQWNITECDVSVSPVQSAPNDTYTMPDHTALLAAGSIAMDGIPPPANLSTPGSSYQFSRYNNR